MKLVEDWTAMGKNLITGFSVRVDKNEKTKNNKMDVKKYYGIYNTEAL